MDPGLKSNVLVRASCIYEYEQAGLEGSPGWGSMVRKTLDLAGFGHAWENKGFQNSNSGIHCITEKLKSMYVQEWTQRLSLTADWRETKLRTYAQFKSHYALEDYLISTRSAQKRSSLTIFRLSLHRLAIELGRHSRPKTPIENRTCDRCNHQRVQDEEHIVMHCPSFAIKRKETFELIGQDLPEFGNYPSQKKFNSICALKHHASASFIIFIMKSL